MVPRRIGDCHLTLGHLHFPRLAPFARGNTTLPPPPRFVHLHFPLPTPCPNHRFVPLELQFACPRAIAQSARIAGKRSHGSGSEPTFTPRDICFKAAAGTQAAHRSRVPGFRQGGSRFEHGLGLGRFLALQEHFGDSGAAAEGAVDLEGRVEAEQVRRAAAMSMERSVSARSPSCRRAQKLAFRPCPAGGCIAAPFQRKRAPRKSSGVLGLISLHGHKPQRCEQWR